MGNEEKKKLGCIRGDETDRGQQMEEFWEG